MLLIAGLILQQQCARLTVNLPTKLQEGGANGPAHWQHDVQGLNKITATTDLRIAISVRRHIYLRHNVVNCWTKTSTGMCSLDCEIGNPVARGEANGPGSKMCED